MEGFRLRLMLALMGWRRIVCVMECHRGRLIQEAVVREMLSAFGIQVCPRCHRFAGVTGRARVQWREPELVPVPRRTLPN